jgi:hypothetical protein
MTAHPGRAGPRRIDASPTDPRSSRPGYRLGSHGREAVPAATSLSAQHVDAQGHPDLHRHGTPVAEATTGLVKPEPTATDARRFLERLLVERSAANASGPAPEQGYLEQLESELSAARDAYTGLAVTEIATVLGELFGRQAG